MITYCVFAICLFASVSAECIFTETQCRCRKEISGNLCLRYASGNPQNSQCESYECGAGYACDCSGMEMCDIGPCDGNPVIYRPIDTILTQTRQSVSCTAIPKKSCIVSRSPLSCVSITEPKINEIRPNPPGPDKSRVRVEVRGEPGMSFTGFLTGIETDNVLSSGSIIDIQMITGTFDSNGLLLSEIDDIEIPSFTLVLSSKQPGLPGTDLDTNKNGIIDDVPSTFGKVYDAVGIPDSVRDEQYLYGLSLGGVDFKTIRGGEPSLLFRDSCTGELYAVNARMTTIYDARGMAMNPSDFNHPSPTTPTFGKVNPARHTV